MKEFKCTNCGSKRFKMIRVVEQVVDFGREGAIAGHPSLEGSERQRSGPEFQCAECGADIGWEQRDAMKAEVI